MRIKKKDPVQSGEKTDCTGSIQISPCLGMQDLEALEQKVIIFIL